MRGSYLRDRLSQFVMRACSSQPIKCLCTSTKKTNMKKDTGEEASIRDLDVYRQLDKLDFMTAAKILFTAPPKKKKFGLDFHLVQLFFVCMPSLAVYLVAQYARYEMRRMEAELEVKRKQKEEEDKVKEMEALALEEEKRKSDPELFQVKVRLEALEEAVKGIAVASNKPSSSNLTKDQGRKEKEKENPEPGKPKSECKLEDSSTVADERGSSLHSGSPSVDPNQKAASGIGPAAEEPTYDKRGEKSKS